MAKKTKQSPERLEPLPEEILEDKRYALLAPAMSNVVMYSNYDIDTATKKIYDQVPPAALHAVEVMVITGMCRSLRKMQLSVLAETGEMLPEEVINYHLSKNKAKLEVRKEEFAEKQREATWETLNLLASDPNAMRYQRVSNDIAITLEREISAIAEANYMCNPAQIKTLIDSVKGLMDIDPLYMKGKQKEQLQQVGAQAEVTAKAKAEAYFSHLADFQKEADEGADYDDLAAYTNDIVERAGGCNDDQSPSPEDTGDRRGGEADVQVEERSGQST